MARRRHRSARGEGAPGWVWMLFGLSIGLAVAFGVYLHNRPPASAAAASEPARPRAADRSAPAPARALSQREADAARFDFYEVLPQFEVVVPEVETAQRRTAAPAAAAAGSAAPPPVAEPGSYVLQAGSFTSVADADRRQASLALLGVESRIQRVTIDDAVFHRVRIGPITDLGELDRIRGTLRDAGVDTLLMKLP